MRIVCIAVTCVSLSIMALPTLSVGFDPRGAQEAAGLSREFDDATRLQQLQEAPELPPPPLVTVPKPTPPPDAKTNEKGDPSTLLQASQPSDEQARQALQEAEHQLQRERQRGFWHTAWRFTFWSIAGMAMTWAVWSWMVRRASGGIKIG
ncbi:MAG: hypothetical protein ACUVTY_02100 [Armatimonadota bacterium]